MHETGKQENPGKEPQTEVVIVRDRRKVLETITWALKSLM
jgi:hypothetical protein